MLFISYIIGILFERYNDAKQLGYFKNIDFRCPGLPWGMTFTIIETLTGIYFRLLNLLVGAFLPV